MALRYEELGTEFLLDKPPDTLQGSTIGQRIRELRLAKGWAFDRLARETGLSRGTLWEAERKEGRIPWHTTLEAIADALEVPVEYIRDGKISTGGQALSEFPPEAYFRAKGIKRNDLIQMLSHQVKAAQRLNDLEPEEGLTEEDAPTE